MSKNLWLYYASPAHQLSNVFALPQNCLILLAEDELASSIWQVVLGSRRVVDAA